MVRSRATLLYFLSLGATVTATLLVLFAPSSWAAPEGRLTSGKSYDVSIFNEDLIVAHGERIEDNVVLYGGDAQIDVGGTIAGDLSVFGGDVFVAGDIDGDLTLTGGDGTLETSARVGGDVSVVGGKIVRLQGAEVGGEFLAGPGSEWSPFDQGPDQEYQIRSVRRSPVIDFFWRLAQAILWTLLITGLVVLISWLTPDRLNAVARTGEEETALTFAAGFMVALGVGFLALLLMVTICLAPIAVLLIGLVAILGLVGWAVTCFWLGRRLAQSVAAGSTFHPLVWTGLVALVLTGVAAFAWALLPCLGILVALLFGSPGVGSVLVHLSRRNQNGDPGEPAPDPGNESNGPDGGNGVDGDGVDGDGDEGVADDGQVDSDATVSSDRDAHAVESDGEPDPDREDLHDDGDGASEEDDFRRIRGIGPSFELRLRQAGIETYAQLAALSPDDVSQILGWSAERVIRDGIIEQAAQLADQAADSG